MCSALAPGSVGCPCCECVDVKTIGMVFLLYIFLLMDYRKMELLIPTACCVLCCRTEPRILEGPGIWVLGSSCSQVAVITY